MQKNVGGIDRGARIIAGLAIIAAGVLYESWWGAIGVVPLMTGVISFCPAYPLLGISSCKKKASEEA